ncbi:piRNA pathway germ-plasm component [Popillia japonica]|uniref:PiRNA pathway germ-plasm component n=1 Tax=Popillia japonica TaxID=7064 RepID=A0AAW1N3K9_POPJA
MAEVSMAAGPHWQRLSNQEKEKYQRLAKQNRENQSKQTSIGESMDLVLQEEREKIELERRKKKENEAKVITAVNANTILDDYFYLMHINEFCYWEKEDQYFPAEIALGKFNLREGIIKEDIFHMLVHPGPLPLGYSAIVKVKSEETHQIQHMGNEDNTEEVLMGLISKITEGGDSEKYPTIYVAEKEINMVQKILNQLCDKFDHPNLFDINSLEYFFFCLKNNVSPGGKVWPTVSVSKIQLERDVYDYCSGIACPYHENSEIPVHCSRSRIIRWAYIICDNCIEYFNIPIIKGQHVPVKAVTDPQYFASGTSASRPASVASMASSVRSEKFSDVASETSTVIDDTEISSYHGFDSDSQAGDDEMEWRRPRRPAPKYRTPQNLSQVTDSSQLSQTSSTSDYIPARRPASQSSANPGFARGAIRRGGRGRGILQNRPPV